MSTDESGDSSSLTDLSVVDEILQILYWMRGESLGTDVNATDLNRFLSISEEVIEPILRRLEAAGLVEGVDTGESERPRFRLTDPGAVEGARRFADEFADMTKAGHGECGDSGCDCQRTGDPADCEHRPMGASTST